MEPPAAPGPERLFDSHRFPSDGFLLLALLLYAPVGLCLLVLRLFIGVHVFLVSCALPDSVLRRFIVRVMCSVLGLCVQQSDPRLRDTGVRVYIANHVTQFDHNVINLLTSCNTPALNSAPGFICWSRGFMELGVSGSRAELVDSLKAYSSHRENPPLLLFPEEAATNGRAGLLRFSSWPFSVSDVVQPVALQVLRPLVTVSVADSSWIAELLWTFFVPFTVYQVAADRPQAHGGAERGLCAAGAGALGHGAGCGIHTAHGSRQNRAHEEAETHIAAPLRPSPKPGAGSAAPGAVQPGGSSRGRARRGDGAAGQGGAASRASGGHQDRPGPNQLCGHHHCQLAGGESILLP
ncbi:ancient ubiquitous protein 1 isoform X3 [Strigops habroptila]|uniref:ancient ubiquitous protein 1 isoform X3 n=1 Tax=Strigops habroptila TaxID=2489341 RepID=UPI0011CF57DD|nr:ancient ubiquitous protein 1 isoform X3 [Strigops habroptila]